MIKMKRIGEGRGGGVSSTTAKSSSDDDHENNHHYAPSSKSNLSSNSSYLYAFGFFLCMVLMELTLEGANNAFPSSGSSSSGSGDDIALPYAVTLFQFGFCFLLPCILSKGESLQHFPKQPQEFVPYISLSVIVFGSTFLASLSVRYVSYPTKVIFKSAKLIPTMIVATLLRNNTTNKYGIMDYVAALLLCAGAAGYGYGSGGGSSNTTQQQSSNSYTGICCLLVSIFCDAFTPNLQQRLMSSSSVSSNNALPTSTTGTSSSKSTSFKHFIRSLFLPSSLGGGLSAQELMTNANGVGCIGLVLFTIITGSFFDAIAMATTNPFLLFYLAIIGLSLSVAVLCYTKLIQESGSVVAVAVATLRKVVTVILSYVVYPKSITILHILSGFVVLGGILLSNYSKQRQH